MVSPHEIGTHRVKYSVFLASLDSQVLSLKCENTSRDLHLQEETSAKLLQNFNATSSVQSAVQTSQYKCGARARDTTYHPCCHSRYC